MKKQINIVLIVAVITLWGTVVYKYFKNSFSDNVITSNYSVTVTNNNLEIVRDTIEFEQLTRDPFLNDRVLSSVHIKSSVAVVKSTSKKTIKNIIQQDITQIPEIFYYGYISSGAKEFALLKVNGNLLRLQKKQTKENVTIKSFNKNTITVIFGGQEYSFPKN